LGVEETVCAASFRLTPRSFAASCVICSYYVLLFNRVSTGFKGFWL